MQVRITYQKGRRSRNTEALSPARGSSRSLPRLETARKGILSHWLGTLPSMRTAYLTNLSDAEWSYLEPHFPAPKATGRPRVHHTREILDAIFYILKSGCAWRLLPHDLEHPGRPSTTISGPGASMAPGKS